MYTHSYYHIQLVPLVALGLAPVAEAIIQKATGAPRLMKNCVGGTLGARQRDVGLSILGRSLCACGGEF